MGLSCLRVFVDNDGIIHRVSNVKFERMMRDPERELVPQFAGQRIRSAEFVIELFDRTPYSVCRETFTIFQFDSKGCADVGRYDKQQVALANAMLEPVLGGEKTPKNVLDATQRFVAHGGSWVPTDVIKAQLEQAALGLLHCPQI